MTGGVIFHHTSTPLCRVIWSDNPTISCWCWYAISFCYNSPAISILCSRYHTLLGIMSRTSFIRASSCSLIDSSSKSFSWIIFAAVEHIIHFTFLLRNIFCLQQSSCVAIFKWVCGLTIGFLTFKISTHDIHARIHYTRLSYGVHIPHKFQKNII